jgi:two-component system cell cycle response regulator DivK
MLQNKCILVIEDTVDSIRLFRVMLQLEGACVLEADNAVDGLATAQRRRPDLILMDIHLPGMDGLTATRHLRSDERTRGIPILAVTASVMPSDLDAIERAGCDGCIAKPVEPESFAAEVASYLFREPHSGEKIAGNPGS